MSETKPMADEDVPATQNVADAKIAQALLDRRKHRPESPRVELASDEGGRSIAMCGENGALAQLRALASTGLHNANALSLVIHQLSALNPDAFDREDSSHANAALAMLDELEPQGGAQTMLVAQMVATHIASMACFSRAALKHQTFEGRELNLKHASKLSGLYARQAESLSKLKRKGQQTVNVRHVHVHDGGQAVVGNVSTIPSKV